MNARRLVGVVGIALAISAWAFLAPGAVGGRTAYASVNGASMRPLLTRGDLVVLRRSGSYGVGDVVAYRSSLGNTLVLHRITAVTGGVFTLKGDANGWLDSDTPSRADVVGKLWFSVPALGGILGGPGQFAVAMGLAGILALASLLRRRKHRRAPAGDDAVPPRVKGPAAPPAKKDRTAEGSTHRHRRTADDRVSAIVCGAIAAGFLAISMMSFLSPAQASRSERVAYQHAGRFSYSATAPRGAAYPTGQVGIGDPIFLQIVDRLRVAFAYEMTSAGVAELAGTVTLTAQIREDGSRWSRAVAIGSPARIVGDHGTVSAVLDIAALRTLVARFESSTGLRPPMYQFVLRGQVAAVGTLDGAPLSARFAATLPFTMNGLALQPTLTVVPGEDPSAAAEFAVSRPGTVSATRPVVPTEILGLRTLPLRAAATTGAVVFGALMFVYAIRASWKRVRSMPRRFERMVVESRGSVATPGRAALVNVASMEDLAWIAEQGSRPVLHEKTPVGEWFEVRDGEVVYRFEEQLPDEPSTISV